MKRLVSLLLVFGLVLGAAVPAAAAESSTDQELERITQSVKGSLGLDTGDYSDFRGSYAEGELASLWNLDWSGDAGSLSVSTLTDGTIVSYTWSPYEAVSRPNAGVPEFPQGDPEQARGAAEAFLKQVLGRGESVVLEEPSGLDRLDSTTYRFSGTILLNGLPSPLSCSITVRAADNLVTRFRRDVPEDTFLGEIPTATAKTSLTAAAASLRTTQSLRLEYVLPDESSTQAVLCYLPNPVHTFYVDAKTGNLVDLTEREALLYRKGMGGAANDAAAVSGAEAEAAPGLSDAEQAGIRQMEGVRSQADLDQALRAVPEYGLESYTLASARFSVGQAEEAEGAEAPVRCVLRYSRADGEAVWTRTFVVDARTGQVQTLSASIPWDEGDQAVLTKAQAQAKAEAFLNAYYGTHAAHLALYETPEDAAAPLETKTDTGAYTFCFARKENGYFFPEQNDTVRIDAVDGFVCGFSSRYDASVTFDSPQGVISEQAAMDAWMDTYDVTLEYLLVPRELQGSDAVTRKLLQMGLDAYHYLELGYCLEQKADYRGIDAKSGQPVADARQAEEAGLSYGDVKGTWAQSEIQKLARFRVGYAGGAFQPEKALTQWDLVCLMYSLNNFPLDPAHATDQERKDAYAAAYSMGMLTRAERNDDAAMTRSQLVHALLDAAGYGTVAQLRGIFTCTYPDRGSIPADELGYAALAQGLGLVSGAYNGAAPATRGQAAAMLCRLMDR